MGGKESKQFPVSYEEAAKRVTDAEKRRLQDAFRRCSITNNYLSKQAFLSSVLGEGIPSPLGEQIFSLVGGGRGVSFRELLPLLVLLTRGTREEKVKFLYGILASDSGVYIERGECLRLCGEWEESLDPAHLSTLFSDGDKVSFDTFAAWIEKNHQKFELTEWILSPTNCMSLISHLDTPTFYQTLAGVTHLSEHEIMELEKRFWALVGNSTSGRIDVGIISGLVSPPLPAPLLPGLFRALDENQDGHVDFKELACGVSAACRGPELERQKFCFKIFDADNDGFLNEEEMGKMVANMLVVSKQTRRLQDGDPNCNSESLLSELLEKHPGRRMSLEDYLVWTVEASLPGEFARLVFQLCHVVLGLRPCTRKEEGEIVRGWLEREEQAGLSSGQVWYLLPMAWWTTWHTYVNWAEPPLANGSTPSTATNFGTLTKRKSGSLSNTLATDSNLIVTTGYTQLETDSRPSTPGSVRSFTPDNSRLQSRQSSSPGPSPATPRKSSGGSGSSSGSHNGSSSSSSLPSRPGLIDNSCLIQSPTHRGITVLTGEGGKLKNGGRLARGRDYELVPERLWKFLSQMYGGSPALPRQVIRTKQGKVELELNPLSVKILKHQTIQRPPNVPAIVGGYSAAAMQAGVSSTGYNGLVGGSGPPTVTRRYHAFQAAFSKRTAVGQIDDFLCQRLHVKHEDLRLWLYKGEESSMRMLDNESTTLEDAGFQDEDSILAEIRSRDGTWPEEISSLCGDKRQQSDRQPLVPGVAGLNNLGNTCYMNAALQVVSSTQILAQYFKLNCHLYELNRTNPLGMKGHIAKRFGDLVRDMWSGEMRTIAPIKLRWTIGKYEPTFGSFQQQDSQELLVFLLDGLHEDLNRVTEKPYVELKDSNGRPDIVVASEAWENHVLRNKSIIVDLFHGQLKSKVTCKVCRHESVRFDPFFNLSLPLPMERCISIEVVLILQDGSTPVKYGLAMDMEEKCSAIPPRLAAICGVPPQHLVLVEIVQSQIRVISTTEQKLRTLAGCCIFAYQLATPPAVTAVPGPGCAAGPTTAAAAAGQLAPGEPPPAQTITDIQRSVHSKMRVKGSNSNDSTGSSNDRTVSSNDRTVTTTERTIVNGGGNHVVSNRGEGETAKAVPGGKGGKLPHSYSDRSTADGSDLSPGSQASLIQEAESSGTPPPSLQLTEPRPSSSSSSSRQRQLSSTSSTITSGTLDSDRCGSTSLPVDLGDFSQGIVVCLHRKMLPQEFYFLSSEKYRPAIFGIPLVINSNSATKCQDMYNCVWQQVARLVSPLPPQDTALQSNHATDCDDSLGYEYPFVLKAVRSGGSWCAWCPWSRLCRGCPLPCNSTTLPSPTSFLAIDWDPTALHLRYLGGSERAWQEHSSVGESRRAATEPITLGKCLEAFTQEEQLGEKEKYFCSACKTHQLAVKKLQIWRLPPVLIIHLKRFQCVNDRWIKSHKIVDFPVSGLDPTDYLAAVPAETLNRYKELASQGRIPKNRSSLLSSYTTASTVATIAETNDEQQQLSPPPHSGTTAAAARPSHNHHYPATEIGLDVVNNRLENLDRLNLDHNSEPIKTTDDQDGEEEEGDDVRTAGRSQSAAAAAAAAGRGGGGGCDFEGANNNDDDDDPNDDSGIESSSGGSGNGGHPTLERRISEQVDVFEPATAGPGGMGDSGRTGSQAKPMYRTRQISTSLVQDPVLDDNLKDFHGHLLEPGRQPLDIRYNMYAMVCHSGVLGGGHYVSYSRQPKNGGAWFCHNDSSCKEVPEANIDKSTAYILMYAREGLSMTDYLPDTSGLKADTGVLDEEFEIDFKKQCCIM